MTRELPSHDAMVAAIVATYQRATDAQRDAGRAWYPAAEAIARAIGLDAGMPAERVAYIMAALSPRNPWRWNVADAHAFATAARDGRSRPAATTFSQNAERAWSLATGQTADAWTTSAPKVRAFVRAILGDVEAVVIDTWAMRVATAGQFAEVSDREYPFVASAYRDAAGILAADARDVQAVTWTVAQDAGLASARRGRHDLSFKRGTSPFILTMFGQPVQLAWTL